MTCAIGATAIIDILASGDAPSNLDKINSAMGLPPKTLLAGVAGALGAAAVAAQVPRIVGVAVGVGEGTAVVAPLVAPPGKKLAQQIARFAEAGGAANREAFMQHANELAARAREAGNAVTGTVGTGVQALQNATIFREGSTFMVVDSANVIRSYVPNATPGGIVAEFVRLGGRI